jgi:oligopeptide/dipeptide ABC transporter ATP-binding protein
LLASLPKLSELEKEIQQLPGSVPDAINPPSGCSFHPRCKFVMDRCRTEQPDLKEVKANHKVACYLY